MGIPEHLQRHGWFAGNVVADAVMLPVSLTMWRSVHVRAGPTDVTFAKHSLSRASRFRSLVHDSESDPAHGYPRNRTRRTRVQFSDLHDPERLASLYERFCEEVEAADPALWHEWEAYRSAPDTLRPPIALSNLLVAMAPHVSRFVARLFQVQPSVDTLTAVTRDQDDLFRFKVDFVRRRVLPLVKGGARVVSTPDDEEIVATLIAGSSGRRGQPRTWSSPSRAPAAR